MRHMDVAGQREPGLPRPLPIASASPAHCSCVLPLLLACCLFYSVLPLLQCAASATVCCRCYSVLPLLQCAAAATVYCRCYSVLPLLRCAASVTSWGQCATTTATTAATATTATVAVVYPGADLDVVDGDHAVEGGGGEHPRDLWWTRPRRSSSWCRGELAQDLRHRERERRGRERTGDGGQASSRGMGGRGRSRFGCKLVDFKRDRKREEASKQQVREREQNSTNAILMAGVFQYLPCVGFPADCAVVFGARQEETAVKGAPCHGQDTWSTRHVTTQQTVTLLYPHKSAILATVNPQHALHCPARACTCLDDGCELVSERFHAPLECDLNSLTGEVALRRSQT